MADVSVRTVDHSHTPLLRVVQRSWESAADASYSQARNDRRWNTRDFPALYCCCGERVARANAVDPLRRSNTFLEDLTPDTMPQLAEIDWAGELVDVASHDGLTANGFAVNYPVGVTIVQCQQAATNWHAQNCQGVVCRSVPLHRLGRETAWTGSHEDWAEVAIFTQRSRQVPREIGRRDIDFAWLHAAI